MALRVRPEDAEVDGEVHFLGSKDPFVEKILCYPRAYCEELRERLKTLKDMGFEYLVELGKNVHGLRILGKGYRAVVVAAFHSRYGLGSLKVLRLDCTKSSLLREVEMIQRALPTELPPQVYFYGGFYVFSELLPPHKCRDYSNVLIEYTMSSNRVGLVKLLSSTLRLLHMLDLTMVDHTEINRPDKHVFYCNGKLKVVDWESARLTSRPSNLTSFISFIMFRFRHSRVLRNMLGYNVENVIGVLERYKSEYSQEAFNQVLAALHLD